MTKRLKRYNQFLMILSTLYFQLLVTPAHSNPTESTSEADAEAKGFQFAKLQVKLRTMPPGPERDYFAGLLANAENRIPESITLLTAALPSVRESRPDRAAIALQALADDYTKNYQYGEAAETDAELLTHFSRQLTPEQIKGTKDDKGIMEILRGAPPQTVTWSGPVSLKTQRNPINSLNVELTVNVVAGPWLLDTGANLSLVTKSFAERLGLKPLPGVAYTQAGLTGIENPLHVALLPTLQMGNATLHNVVIMILDDASLNIGLGKQSYQINGIIGYPVFQALEAIKFLHDGEFEAGPTTHSDGSGAQMYMHGLSPIVECKIQSEDLPFSFDSGASGTDFYVRYYREFRGNSKLWHWKKGKQKEGGAGGAITRKIYVQPEVSLGIGDKTAALKKVSIYKTGTGTDTDDLYGNLGQDVPVEFASFTLDFKRMIFSLGQPLHADSAPNSSAEQNPGVKEQ